MKVAKIVAVSLLTRIIVEENATEEQMMQIARPKLISALNEDGLLDHVECIEPDEECPYGSLDMDKFEEHVDSCFNPDCQ